MTTDPTRLALFLGPEDLAHPGGDRTATFRTLLDGVGLEMRSALTADEAADALSSGEAEVALVDCARVAAVAKGYRNGGARPALVATGCVDSAAVALALADGAVVAARGDATPEEIASLVRAALQVSTLERELAVAVAGLERQSSLVMKDDLTSAYNRRFFDRCLDDELGAAQAAGVPLSLVFMDVDDLKTVNVRHGHAMGSLVLREIAQRTIAAVRPNDRVIRYGGDEFCIVLPGLDGRQAVTMAQTIREAFAAKPFAVEATGGVALTASFGIASHPDNGSEPALLIHAADTAMLLIKDRQKNGILLAETA